MEVWSTSNLRPLRTGEEKKKKKKPQRQNIMAALLGGIIRTNDYVGQREAWVFVMLGSRSELL